MALHSRPVALVAGVFLLVSSASAQGTQPSIYLDVGAVSSGYGTPTSAFAAAAPLPGEWNNLDVDLATGMPAYTTPQLFDTTGSPTSVTVEWIGIGGGLLAFAFDEPNTFGEDQALMDDIGYVAGLHEFRFRGLPDGDYDVYTYAMAPDNPAFVSTVNVVGSADPLQNVVGAFPGGYVLGVTHAFHSVNVSAGGDLVIEVDVGSANNSVNGIQIVPMGGPGTLGTPYCSPAVTNSSGLPAEMFASGSVIVGSNNLTISCLEMPRNVFGFFITSQTQGFVANPNGSAGNLCVLGSIGRYVGPGQIQNSGPMGTIGLAIDLTNVPQPNGFVAVQPGQTWNFQTWFRDSSGGVATSNFSDGLEILFN